MKRISIIAAILCLFAGIALAQTYPAKQVGQIYPTDLFQDISKGNWPVVVNQYVTALGLQSWVFGSNLGHGSVPVLTTSGSVCGSGSSTAAVIVGTDYAGTVTLGNAAATSCVLTFALAYNAAPSCTLSQQSGAAGVASFAWATTASAITVTQTSTASDVFNYLCVAQAGG